MTTTIRQWGKSYGIRIPESILKTALLKLGDTVELVAENHKIIIRKSVGKKHITLKERLKDFNGEYIFEEVDWSYNT